MKKRSAIKLSQNYQQTRNNKKEVLNKKKNFF